MFDEVDRSVVPAGSKVVPTRMLFAIKSDGTFKVRIVVRGDLMAEGGHCVETTSSMVSPEAIRMAVALAAGNDMRLFSTDLSQAYLNADIDVANLYCDLLELPPEMLCGEFGKGKAGGMVAHVRRAWNGLKSSPLLWDRQPKPMAVCGPWPTAKAAICRSSTACARSAAPLTSGRTFTPRTPQVARCCGSTCSGPPQPRRRSRQAAEGDLGVPGEGRCAVRQRAAPVRERGGAQGPIGYSITPWAYKDGGGERRQSTTGDGFPDL